MSTERFTTKMPSCATMTPGFDEQGAQAQDHGQAHEHDQDPDPEPEPEIEHGPEGEPRISDDALIRELQHLTVEKGKVVTAEEIDAEGKFAADTYIRRFDGLPNARAQAGVDALGVAIMLDEICPHSVEERANGVEDQVDLDLDWDEPGIGPAKRGF